MSVVRAKTTVRMTPEQLKKKAAAGTFRSLKHAGGAIRLTARRSIRKRKKASQPGSPPHTQSGNLKRSIRYEATQDDVKIGPVNEFGGRIWNLHEFGGSRAPARKLLKVHKFSVGEYGPIRYTPARTAGSQGGSLRGAGGRFVSRGARSQVAGFHRARLRTTAQAARATRLVKEENERRMGPSRPRRYPKRPFMGPALELMRPRLPKFWRNSVR